jgi:hypothetical protein
MLKVYIVGYGASEAQVIHKLGFTVVETIEESNCLWFCGGADIDPSTYGQVNVDSYLSHTHDQIDMDAWQYYIKNQSQFTMLLGICRGAQLINALSGGNMWQDVDGHHGDHYVLDLRDDVVYKTNSIHHQMMRPTKEAEIIAVACSNTGELNLSTYLTDDTGTYSSDNLHNHLDVELCFYPSNRAVCIQSHPEWDNAGTYALFSKVVKEKLETCIKLQKQLVLA